MRTLRNVFRRRGRALLTIFGITIGVFALVVMGSIAEKLQLLVDGGALYYADKVTVTDASTFAGFGISPISASLVRDAERIEGVRRASVTLNFLLDDDLQAVSMGTPPMVEATDLRDVGYESFVAPVVEGRDLKPDDRGNVVVGSDLVKQLNAHVGGTVEVRGEQFRVVGIYGKTLSAPDATVAMSLEDAQELFIDTLPKAVSAGVQPRTLATSIVIFPEQDVEPESLVGRVERSLGSEYNVQGPSGFEELVKQPLEIFNYIIYAVALIALAVGGLSIINTMTMSISERTREIGIRKAVGATRGAIMRQFIAEAAVIGASGGLLGLAIGALLTWSANAGGAFGTTELFLLTPRLALGSVAFALFLGMAAGVYPAWRAAQMSPVEALRYE